MKYLYLIFIVAIACNSNQDSGHNYFAATSDSLFVFEDNKLPEQNVNLGSASLRTFQKEIRCNGILEISPNNITIVSAPIPGQVKQISVKSKQRVSEGQILAVLQDNAYIKLKQYYFETRSQFEYQREDYKRKGELTIENAASIKQLQQAKQKYEVLEARLAGLKNELRLIGITADSLREPDQISSIGYLVSPVTGKISKVNVKQGLFCDEKFQLFEIISSGGIYANISVPEKYAYKINKSQQVELKLNSLPRKTFIGEVFSIGDMNMETSTIAVHVKLKSNYRELLRGSHLEGTIIIESDSCFALPVAAIVTVKNEHFVFIKSNGNRFLKLPIELGHEQNGYYEVLGSELIFRQKNIVLNAASLISSIK